MLLFVSIKHSACDLYKLLHCKNQAQIAKSHLKGMVSTTTSLRIKQNVGWKLGDQHL